MLTQEVAHRLREILSLETQVHLVAQHSPVVLRLHIGMRHLIKEHLHVPLGCLQGGDQPIQHTGIGLTLLPICLAFIAQIMLYLMPPLREDRTDLDFIGVINVGRILSW